MRFGYVVERCRGTVEKILEGKIREGRKLSEDELTGICRAPFAAVRDILGESGEESVLTPLGVFRKYRKSEFEMFNPRTKKQIKVPERMRVRFTMTKSKK